MSGHNQALSRIRIGIEPIEGEYAIRVITKTGFVFERLSSGKTFNLSSQKLNQVAAHLLEYGFVYARKNGPDGISKTSAIEKTTAFALGLKRVAKIWVQQEAL